MEIEPESFICFCNEFPIKKIALFNEKLLPLLEDMNEDKSKQEDLEKPINRLKILPYYGMRYEFRLTTRTFEQQNKAIEKIISKLKMDMEQSKDTTRFQKDIGILERDQQKLSVDLKVPKCIIKLKFTVQEKIELSKLIDVTTNVPEKPILDVIDSEGINENESVLCGSICLDKKKYSLIEGFEFRKEIEVGKNIKEKLGIPYLANIKLAFEKSPLGIDFISIGEKDEVFTFNLRVDFKSQNISKLNEKFELLKEILQTFIVER